VERGLSELPGVSVEQVVKVVSVVSVAVLAWVGLSLLRTLSSESLSVAVLAVVQGQLAPQATVAMEATVGMEGLEAMGVPRAAAVCSLAVDR